MTTNASVLLRWIPRIAGFLMCVFLAVFALDAFAPGQSTSAALADVVIHLFPSVLVLAIVIASWRREWFGAVAFVVLAAAYALMAGSRLDWVLAISGPLLIVGGLFFWSWRSHDRHAATGPQP